MCSKKIKMQGKPPFECAVFIPAGPSAPFWNMMPTKKGLVQSGKKRKRRYSIANWTCIVLPSCAHRKPESWLLPANLAKVLFPTKYQRSQALVGLPKKETQYGIVVRVYIFRARSPQRRSLASLRSTSTGWRGRRCCRCPLRTSREKIINLR